MAIRRIYAERTEFRITPDEKSVRFKLYVEGDRGTVWRLKVWNKGQQPVRIRIGDCTKEELRPGESFMFPHMAAGYVCYPSPLPGEKAEADVEVWGLHGWKPGATYRLVFVAYYPETRGVTCPSEPPQSYLPLFWSLLDGGKVDASKRCISFKVSAGMGYWIYVEPVDDPHSRYIGIFAGKVDDNEFWHHVGRYNAIVFETISYRKLYEITAPTDTISVCISTFVGYWRVCLYGRAQ